jgi:hypothetical protein
VKHIRFASAIFALAAMALLVCGTAAAQGLFGAISGTVTDPTGAVLAGATVKVTNVNTGVVSTYTTNGAGLYNATSLNPGVYNVQAEAKGFRSAAANGISLEVNANPKVSLTLSVGESSQVIEVTSEAPILQTQQSDLGQTVTSRQLEQLPTFSGSGRNIYSLIPLAGGVSQQLGCDGCGDNGNLRINGDRPRNQDYVLDGATIEQPVFGGQALSPSVDSIQEFRVETNSMSAEYGKAGGGIITAVTKSGTNSFHGSAYEYNRNQNFDARNYFNRPPDRQNPYDYNEFGGSVGGPIIKNKLFFFTDYQGIRQHGSSSPQVANLPNSDFRTGNLRALCTAGFDASGTCLNAKGQVFFPGTKNAVPFNTIPSGQISPIAQKLLTVIPSGTTAGAVGTNQLTFSPPFNDSLNRFNPRVDYNLSQKDHIFGVLHREKGQGIAYDVIVGPAGEQISKTDDYATTLGWTHTVSPTVINDFRFGYMHRIGDRATYGQGFTSPSDFGLSGIPNCLSSVPGTAGGKKCGTPGVSISGYTGLSTGQTLYEPAGTLEFSDMITKLVGRHNLKIGAEFRHYAIDNYQPNGVVGSFSFTGAQTGSSLADFLFGVVSGNSQVQVQNAMVSTRAWADAFYVQDDFKMTSKLTLNLGMRYQIDYSFHETHNGLAFFNPYTAKWEQFGVNAPATSFDTWWKEFGPRVGFAWNPKSGFVVHGGYGITYPGTTGHGRAGDGQPGPNLLANTPIPAGTNWAALPTITSPDPKAITAPLPVNSNVSFASWAPRQQAPTYMQLWNLTLEQQLGRETVAQLAYVGSHGTHLPVNYAYNVCQQTPQSTAALKDAFSATTTPYCPAVAAALNAAGSNVYCCLTINPGWWGLSSSVYNSLQAKIDHRFSHGFSLLTNFTWSKLMDDSSSDWGGFWSLDVLGQDFYNRKAERSVSAGDVPLRLTVAPIVELPFGPGKAWLNQGIASEVLGGWRAAGIYTISDGTPFGVTDNAYGFCNGAGVLEDRPTMIGSPLPSGFKQGPTQWFNAAAFDFSGTCPAKGLVDLTGPFDVHKAFGNAPRYFSNLRNPGVNDFDFSLQKDFKLPLTEQTRLTFQADAFNVLNHAQFAEPVSDPLQPNFGVITRTAVNSRTLQLGLHLYF